MRRLKHRKAFTLLEVLISIGLLGIIVLALFSTVSMMKDSNDQLYGYLQKSQKITKSTQILYLDIISSDGNLTIKKDDFSRLCIEETKNSLYALSLAKVCWVVMKKDNTLVRVEGNDYALPTRLEDRVEVNPVMKQVELFDIYHEKDKVLVALKQKNKEPINFMIQGINKPILKKPAPKKPGNNKQNTVDNNTTAPNNTNQATQPNTTNNNRGVVTPSNTTPNTVGNRLQ